MVTESRCAVLIAVDDIQVVPVGICKRPSLSVYLHKLTVSLLNLFMTAFLLFVVVTWMNFCVTNVLLHSSDYIYLLAQNSV